MEDDIVDNLRILAIDAQIFSLQYLCAVLHNCNYKGIYINYMLFLSVFFERDIYIYVFMFSDLDNKSTGLAGCYLLRLYIVKLKFLQIWNLGLGRMFLMTSIKFEYNQFAVISKAFLMLLLFVLVNFEYKAFFSSVYNILGIDRLEI